MTEKQYEFVGSKGDELKGNRKWDELDQGEKDSYYILRNICRECGPDVSSRRENYSMMWGDAELICDKCNRKIRDLDYG